MEFTNPTIDRLLLLSQKTQNDLSTHNTIEWTEVTSFLNSWVNYESGWTKAAYTKDAHGFVHLKGTIKSGTVGSVAFNLPYGYRPSEKHLFPIESNAAFGRLRIDTNGDVTPQYCSNVSANIDGITFYVG